MVTAEDLRVELGFDEDDWTDADKARAEQILERSRRIVVALAGSSRVARAEAAGDLARLDAIDEATIAYAIPRFANPERVMQRRAGSDNSVSFADSSEAATGRREAVAILRGAFGSRAGTTTT